MLIALFFSFALTEVDNICRGKVDSCFKFKEQQEMLRVETIAMICSTFGSP